MDLGQRSRQETLALKGSSHHRRDAVTSVLPQANSFPVSCCVVSAGRPKQKFSPQVSSLAPFSSSYHSSHNVACRSCTLDIFQSLDLCYFKIQENSFVNFPSVIHCPPANTNYSNNQPASHHHLAVWADGLAAACVRLGTH